MSNGTALAVRDDVRALDRTDRYEERAAIAPSMTFESLVAMGDQLVGTGFLPKHIRNGAQAAAVILAGQELGMKPMRALRSLQLVEGKVVEAADSQLSRFHADGGKSVWKRLDETGAVLWLRHPNGAEHEEAFTIEDAQRAKLLGKDVWQKYPKAMLRSRAITAALKSIGWEGGIGTYDPDEAVEFMPKPGSTHGATSSAAPEPTAIVDKDPAMGIDDALAYPLPGKPTAWRGNGGKPLGELSKRMIPAVREWIHKIITEQEEKDGVSVPVNYELRKACDLILAVRGGQEPRESEAKPAASGAENPTTLAPGKVEDALVPKTTAAPKTSPAPARPESGASLTDLTKRLNKLLQHEKLTKEERDDFLARSATATTTEDLQRLVLEAEEVINSPF